MANILLVEDNPNNRNIFETALTHHGYHLTVAEDGQRALDILESMVPDLILLDLSLPKVDGWTVARTIREKTTDVSRVPILALTAHAMKGDRERALSAGCDAYLSKPISVRELRRTVARMLEKGSQAA